MILQSLARYYNRLTAEQGKLPAYGWSREKIRYCIVLNEDGSIFGVQDLLDEEDVKGKKIYKPKSLIVPAFPEERTSGVKANYCWDNTAYALGLSQKPKDLQEKYDKFWQNVSSFNDSQSKSLQTLAKFHAWWNVGNRQSDKLPGDFELDSNIVFRCLADGNRFVHECPEFIRQWQAVLAEYQNGLSTGQCLIEGKSSHIANLHIRIKGVDNAQSSGAYIVSFNKEAFESYGLKQGKNASVGTVAAFKYVTALNHLLRKGNNKQRLKIGDAITLFWAEASENTEADLAENFMSEAINPTDAQQATILASLLQQVSQGIPLKELRPDLEPSTKFYILGLSPNAARLSVRYWYATTLNELAQRIAQHYHDLRLEPQQGNGMPEIWKLTYATAPIYTENGKQKTDADRISPQLAGNLARAIFTGQAYPTSLLSQLLNRMRLDGVVSFTRVSLCKAVINRKIRLYPSTNEQELPMSLDVEEKNVAYRMGRLFAVLEGIQKEALGDNLNATIRDRYWGAASATPALVFPMLMRNAMNHLSKIRKDTGKQKLAFFFEKLIGDIEKDMPTVWPKNINLEDQGRFAIGYYHQRFTRKIKDETGANNDNPLAADKGEDQTAIEDADD